MRKSSNPDFMHAKRLGAIYTPDAVATWLMLEVEALGFVPEVVLDPAAGDGALLEAALEIFPMATLRAADVDPTAWSGLRAKGYVVGAKANDALGKSAWFDPRSHIATLVYSNPPWGADMGTNSRLDYRNRFELARGQFDTFDLFVEKTIRDLPDGGWAALFIPDSVLLPQHQATRQYVLENARIHKIVRLPEGTFPNASIGSVAIVLEKGAASPDFEVVCSRISRQEMKLYDTNPRKLFHCSASKSHRVRQSSWMSDIKANWIIDISKTERHVIEALRSAQKSTSELVWDRWFESGRGLELGKKSVHLVREFGLEKASEYVPVAVGEDLHRRSVNPSRFVSRFETGIRFKDEFSTDRRLLVRKTGIGIKAAVSSGIVTTQTIYHFRPNADAPEYALDFVAGFLASRVTVALQLAKSGEIEWRSHPYVTQKSIKEIPIRVPFSDSEEESLARRLAMISRHLHESPQDLELELESDVLVAQLLGGREELVDWAPKFLRAVTGCSYAQYLSNLTTPKALVA